MSNPLISIVIPTLNRIDCLRSLLISLQNTKNKNIQIIIVDQNKNGLIDSLISEFSVNISILHFKVDFVGLSKARNFGMDHASGEYVIFPDDDCEFFVDTFDIICSEIKKNDVDVLCGKTVDRNIHDSVVKFSNQSGYLKKQHHQGMFIEAVMLFKTSVIKKYKFDEMMGIGCFYGSQEGYDLVLRLLDNNAKMYYTPVFMLYHPQKVASCFLPEEIMRSFNYSKGFAYLCKKHNLWQKYYSRLIKIILYLPFCFLFKRKKTNFYLAELSGLIAGNVITIV